MKREGIIVFIVGPTAIGKTRLAIKLATRIKGEIISSDSMQVYRGMAILSQAPTASERKKARHHLVGVLDPGREYNAASFINRAAKLIGSLIKRGKIPVVAGGSGLYIKALMDGLFPSPPPDLGFRGSMQKFVRKYGAGKLHEKLAKIDPASAAKIHPNDERRIIRALEIRHSTGKTMTELKSRTRGLADRYDIRIFGLTNTRSKIYKEIELRTDRMFEGRVLGEVKRLKKRRLSKTASAILGLKEISDYLDGKCDLDTAKSLIKKKTRHFAKRQFTWFRADKRIRWFDMDRASEAGIIKRIIKGMG